MNMKSMQETVGSDVYTLTHYFDTSDCYDIVKERCEEFWKNAPKDDSAENYQFGDEAKAWSLGPMLKNNDFAGGYTILSVNDVPWSFGGIKRYTDDIALILGRHFCFFTLRPMTIGLLVPFQLEIAKELGFKKAWITMMGYNDRMYRTWQLTSSEYDTNRHKKRDNILYKNTDSVVERVNNLGKQIVNYTEQSVMEWSLE